MSNRNYQNIVRESYQGYTHSTSRNRKVDQHDVSAIRTTVPCTGFAKSRPITAQRPGGPKAQRPGGPEAHTVLLSSGKSTRMLRFASGLGAQMKDDEFEFVYHFHNHFNPFRSFLSLHVAK